MSTRSNSSNLFSPLRDPESLIRRRNLGEPSSLFDFEEVMSIPHNNMGPLPAGPPPPPNNGPPPVVRPNGQAHRSMEELGQPSIDGRGGPIALIPIQATDFGLQITQHMKQNGVSDDALRLSLFPYSLTHHACACGPHSFTECPAADGYTQKAAYATTVNYNSGAQVRPSNGLTSYMKSNEATLRAMQTQMTNMKTELRNELLRNEFKSSLDARTNKIENQNNKMMTQNNELKNMMANFFQMQHQNQNQSTSGSGSLPSNTIVNPRGDVKAITTQSGVAYDGPTIPPTPSPLPKEVERETEATKDKPEVAPKPKPKLSIPYPSRLNDQKLHEKANNQMLKFLQIFQRLHFDISFTDALFHMPKFASTFKSLLINDEAITFKVRQTSRDSRSYEMINKVNVIDVGCEEYAQEVLGFSDSFGQLVNPTPSDPIIASSSPSFNPLNEDNSN
ncbi:hypothetical protein Tco_0271997 [Tanacetum coccineum]